MNKYNNYTPQEPVQKNRMNLYENENIQKEEKDDHNADSSSLNNDYNNLNNEEYTSSNNDYNNYSEYNDFNSQQYNDFNNQQYNNFNNQNIESPEQEYSNLNENTNVYNNMYGNEQYNFQYDNFNQFNAGEDPRQFLNKLEKITDNSDLAPSSLRKKAALLDFIILLIPSSLMFYILVYDTFMELISNSYLYFNIFDLISPLIGKLTSYLVIYILLFIFFNIIIPIFTKGQTIGKKINKLRIVGKDDNDLIDFPILFKREMRKFLSIIFLFGIIQLIFSKSGNTMHDKSANTKVIYEEIPLV